MPKFPYIKTGRLGVQDTRRQSFSPDEWVTLERCAPNYYIKGLSSCNKDGSDRGYLPITKGKNKGKPSKNLDLRNNLFSVNKGKGLKKSLPAQHQLYHRQMIYLGNKGESRYKISITKEIPISLIRVLSYN